MFALTLLALPSCAGIEIKNGEVCTVAGVLQAGADCAETLTPKTRSMNFEALVDYLEPQLEKKDAKGKIVSPERGGAIIMSADYFNHIKTKLEQACSLLGDRCTYEIKEQIATLDAQSKGLQAKTLQKKKSTKTKKPM